MSIQQGKKRLSFRFWYICAFLALCVGVVFHSPFHPTQAASLPQGQNVAQFSNGLFSGPEGGNAIVQIYRGTTVGTLTVNFQTTIPATAEGGEFSGDFQITNEQVQFQPGQNTIGLPIPLYEDTEVEGTEYFTVKLTGVGVGNPSVATVNIEDNDQSTCTYSISPSSNSVPANGGTGTVTVTTSHQACTWTAASNASWLTITSGSSGTGNGSVTYQAAANPNTSSRTGSLTIAGQTHTVTQAGQPASCTLSISPTSNSVPNGGATNATISVTSPATCTWTATSNASWITINSGASGNGNGTVTYSVASNFDPNQRTGTITVAIGSLTQTHTVTQAGVGGCVTSLTPPSRTVGASGGTFSVTVNAPGGCAWTVETTSVTPPWIINISPLSGNGSGIVTYTVLSNPNPTGRSGSFEIRDNGLGRTHSVVQQGTGCGYAAVPDHKVILSDGGTDSFGIEVTGNSPIPGTTCHWIAVSEGFAVVNSPNEGSGSGTVSFTVGPNTSNAERVSTIAIFGDYTTTTPRFTIRQLGVPCATLSVPGATISAAGGNRSVNVIVGEDGCSWTSFSDASWISITSGGSGSTSGTVTMNIAPNTTGAQRIGAVYIANRAFYVLQRP